VNTITKSSDGAIPFDPDEVHIVASKHFRKTWMRRWGWDYADVRDALRNAHRVARAGRTKWEAFVRKKGNKKLVLVYDEEIQEVYVITGAEG